MENKQRYMAHLSLVPSLTIGQIKDSTWFLLWSGGGGGRCSPWLPVENHSTNLIIVTMKPAVLLHLQFSDTYNIPTPKIIANPQYSHTPNSPTPISLACLQFFQAHSYRKPTIVSRPQLSQTHFQAHNSHKSTILSRPQFAHIHNSLTPTYLASKACFRRMARAASSWLRSVVSSIKSFGKRTGK